MLGLFNVVGRHGDAGRWMDGGVSIVAGVEVEKKLRGSVVSRLPHGGGDDLRILRYNGIRLKA